MPRYPLKLSPAELDRYRLMAEVAAAAEHELWELAGITAGATVADVGCGPGAVSVVVAERVGPGGRVLAVDRDPEAVEAARAGAARAGVDNITFAVGDADDTGLEPGCADAVMIRHVLAHNGGREDAIVAHAASVARPGGAVYLVDVEISALRTRPNLPELEDLNDRYRQWHARRGNDLSIGLRLAELLAGAGLDVADFRGRFEIVPVPPGFRPPSWAAREALVADGLATDDDVARWDAAFRRADEIDPRPTTFAPLFVAVGRRPV
ncbi:MAG TPA: methyltransferase domain-containing protein [Acidimicrobiales bacterium]|nr:methyltransferase domain-containing protein [Acidimicrobiales bacterium]